MEQFLAEHVLSLEHWPFLASAIVFMLVGQVMKSSVWTRERAASGSFFWWAYKTMPLHPVVAGAATGLLWKVPEPGVEGIAAIFYFACSGASSVWLYQILKGVAKKRGIVLGDLPGQSTAPKPPPVPVPSPTMADKEDEEITPIEKKLE